jgi:hypothetical protein
LIAYNCIAKFIEALDSENSPEVCKLIGQFYADCRLVQLLKQEPKRERECAYRPQINVQKLIQRFDEETFSLGFLEARTLKDDRSDADCKKEPFSVFLKKMTAQEHVLRQNNNRDNELPKIDGAKKHAGIGSFFGAKGQGPDRESEEYEELHRQDSREQGKFNANKKMDAETNPNQSVLQKWGGFSTAKDELVKNIKKNPNKYAGYLKDDPQSKVTTGQSGSSESFKY